MSWSDFYLFCFMVGFSLSFVSFLAGTVHLHIHVPARWHLPFHVGHHGGGLRGGLRGMRGGGGKGGGAKGGGVSWFNASSVLAFLAWFGGTGYLLTKYSTTTTVLVVSFASVAGVAAGAMVFKFLVKLAGPPDEPLTDDERRVEGSLAIVSMTIREGGTGEIIFPLGGSRRCSGARSADGKAIETGAEVVIEKYEQGIAYVKRWEEFVAS
jgi:membrane protein implicated in regulation of membrane protease activity